jgi:hypothetical protein
MKTILTIILLSLPTFGWTCTCMSLTKKEAKSISKRADYILLGTAVENVHHQDSIKTKWDDEKYGVEVKFKVEKIINGKIDSEYVFINQFETGNCKQVFEFGVKYIIVGTRIKYFENLRPFREAVYAEDEIFETVQPPPPPPIGGMTINKMKCYNIERELVDYWNRIAEKEVVLYTNQCSSFYANSVYGQYFKK